jgi:hypothetical protein
MSDHRVVAFLSDYGLADEFVGVCKAVIVGLAPGTTIVDLTHELAPHDVRAGALALVRAVQYLPERSVVLAVVDPGVGTERRLVAVECEAATLVGPDNGLLAPAVAMIGGATRAVSLTNEDYHIASPGPTFAGRDILAPAAGYLARGASLEDLGEAIDPIGMMPGLVSLPNEQDGAIVGEVWWVDHFGNCQLNIDPAELQALGAGIGGSLELRFGGHTRMARWVGTYADAKPSELVLLVDSNGLISIALDQRSASEELGLRGGSGITVVPPPGPPETFGSGGIR